MRGRAVPMSFIIFGLLCSTVGAEPAPVGTKGQNFDRIVVENTEDDEVEVVARIMTINRRPNSASTIVVTDNGQPVLGPQTLRGERWSGAVAIRGKGAHEVVAVCGAINAEPVYCSLSAAETKAPR